MNIGIHLKTNKYFLVLFVTTILFVSTFHIVSAQVTDTIIPIGENPEKILRKIDVRRIANNGFNFWQDKFSGHWAGVDFGFNTFLHKNYSGYDSEFMNNDISRSNSTYINLIQQSIGLQHNRNTIGLVTGLGVHFQSYRLDQNTTIERIPNNVIVPKELYFDDNQKSKLSVVSLTMPLLAEFQIPINHYENRLYFSGGLYLGYRLSSHTKIKYRI
ncbi:MAG: outer membrane beta-barrel protein [Draconibacterium sp.]|nr:outer membrane beta-barrel protein [Draconibacterium sp.]